MSSLKLLVFALSFTIISGYIVNPGPKYPPTKGEIWPKPRLQVKTENYFILNLNAFQIKVLGNNSCLLLRNAIIKYEEYILKLNKILKNALNVKDHTKHKKMWLNDKNFLGNVDILNVTLNGSCNDMAIPSDNENEAYTIMVSHEMLKLNSTSIWGILRGLESFYQLIYLADDYLSVRINEQLIEDSPRYSHRGLLLDTSRHYIPVDKIKETIESMSQNKLNVFHWHIVDDQSFPYVSLKFPELSAKGAFYPTMIYTPSDVSDIIEFARVRGIRVIPEFDTPGHTRSWGVAHPEILTSCEGDLVGNYGPLNPIKNETYTFMYQLLAEIKQVFVDKFIHLGGDEVDFDCWQSNSEIKNFMKDHNITENYEALESFYIQKIINEVNRQGSKSIVWEEVFSNGVNIPKDTVVHVWKDDWRDTMYNVTNSGYQAILSSCWYLDHLGFYGDWADYYNCEPNSFSDNPQLQSFIIGGEACMWSERVDENNVISRIWPRASAAAERLWSLVDDSEDLDYVRRRLEEHTCRLNRRGIKAQPPNGPGFCIQ